MMSSTPTRAVLDRLTPAEQELYADLVDGTFGPAIRLEQERISFAAVERARSAAVNAGLDRSPCAS